MALEDVMADVALVDSPGGAVDQAFENLVGDALAYNQAKEKPMKNYQVFKVYFHYGGNELDDCLFKTTTVVATSEEDAKVQSGFHGLINTAWKGDYLTFRAIPVLRVSVEEAK